ncbi:MAG: rhodanese-like domain-containing protein [Mycobacteriales bacterium]
MSAPQVPTVSVLDVPEEAFLLDVREDDEWAAAHVAGACHLPMGELRGRLDELPADRDVVVVCRSGHRSAHVTAYLIGFGRQARNLDGGMQAWAAAGRPMTSESGAPPQVI